MLLHFNGHRIWLVSYPSLGIQDVFSLPFQHAKCTTKGQDLCQHLLHCVLCSFSWVSVNLFWRYPCQWSMPLHCQHMGRPVLWHVIPGDHGPLGSLTLSVQVTAIQLPQCTSTSFSRAHIACLLPVFLSLASCCRVPCRGSAPSSWQIPGCLLHTWWWFLQIEPR